MNKATLKEFNLDNQQLTLALNKLKSQKLKITPLRQFLLDIFISNQSLISQSEILNEFKKNNIKADRISIYRNLQQLKALELIHELAFNQYIYCSHSQCHKHPHLLLSCTECQEYQEITNHETIQKITKSLADTQFFNQKSLVTIRGLCQKCYHNLFASRPQSHPQNQLQGKSQNQPHLKRNNHD